MAKEFFNFEDYINLIAASTGHEFKSNILVNKLAKHLNFDKARRITFDLIKKTASLITEYVSIDYEYSKLACKLIIWYMHDNKKKQGSTFSSDILKRSERYTESIARKVSMLGSEFDKMICYERDNRFDFIGLNTLCKNYLAKDDDDNDETIYESPQDMYMRVSVYLNILDDDDELFCTHVEKTYNLLSLHYVSMASPILFNSGFLNGNLSSCFLLGAGADLKDILKTHYDTGMILSSGGGVGIDMSSVMSRQKDSAGVVKYIKMFDQLASCCNESGGKRRGSIAFYLPIDHLDIIKFVQAKRHFGSEEALARNVFYGVWVSDLFMKRLDAGEKKWYLFCRDTFPGLDDVYGEEYDDLYTRYESQVLSSSSSLTAVCVDPKFLWGEICKSQIETGNPYLIYKDQANMKSNQKNIGMIKSSNLCAEILLHSSPSEYGVCNLGSIVLQNYINLQHQIDFDLLQENARYLVRLLNNVIDTNYYHLIETKRSNFLHRPIGIGVQGLADLFVRMRVPFESERAKQINTNIFEHIYYACVDGSMRLAKERGHSYATFKDSPLSMGKFQFDMWKECHPEIEIKFCIDERKWNELRRQVIEFGVMNSTLTACMPTVSSANIIGSTESIEPIDRCVYKRIVLSGNFLNINKYLQQELIRLNLWSVELFDTIIRNNGTVSNIDIVPNDLKQLYKSVWEMSMQTLIDYSADRAPFICMTQSLNLFVKEPTVNKLFKMHMYAWKIRHLKTGIYYLRSMPATQPAKYTIKCDDYKCCSI